MDWRLVCYTFSLPSSCKIGGGFTKKILRDAMKGILPENIRSRTKKLGFPNLDEGWMSFRAQEFIRDTLNTSEFKSSNLWNAPYILADMETAFKLQDQVRIHKAWKLLQAFYLIKAFKTKAKGAGK
jgi:asparagine synthase (glutamine-hydrolysing)